MSKLNNQKLVDFLYEIGSLRKVVRSHQQRFYTNDFSDNIASHSYRVTVIALFLAKMEKVNVEKVLIMALLHDSAEARSGDQNWVHKKYVKVFEDEILDDQMKELPHSENISNTINEYQERKSKEAIVAKDADILDQMFLLEEYAWQGNKEAQRWIDGRDNTKRLKTKTAKALAEILAKTHPNTWAREVWTSERR